MVDDERQQLANAPYVRVIHHRVVEHHARWGAAAERVREPGPEPVAGRRSDPVHVDRQLAEPGDPERRGARLAGQRGEAELGQAAPVSAVQRFQGGVKIGSTPSPSSSPNRSRPAAMSPALRDPPRDGPNSHLRPAGSWFTCAYPCWCSRLARSARSELARQPRLERRRDHGHIDDHAALGERVKQLDQPPVAPAGVVVAEEEGTGAAAASSASRTGWSQSPMRQGHV